MEKNLSLITGLIAGMLSPHLALGAGGNEAMRPNVVFIMTDQQSANMMSCTGNPYLETPNLDRLASTGVRFSRAYATNPVCVPSRFSMMTGLMASQANGEDNGMLVKALSDSIFSYSMGNIFRNAGYQAVYGGKIHLPDHTTERLEDVGLYGFDNITYDYRIKMAKECATFIKQKHDTPFLMVASFMNPHDIGYMALNAYRIAHNQQPSLGLAWKTLQEALKIPDGMTEDYFFEHVCPPLPDNFEIPDNEFSDAAGLSADFMIYAREHWSERDWRLHRWAYHNLTTLVDKEIGIILDAIKEAGIENNTLIVFTSDHGDMAAAHRLEHKGVFYEESVRVPLIFSWKGKIPEGIVDNHHYVMTGLDILPTLCDYAGIVPPHKISGISLKDLMDDNDRYIPRRVIVSETRNARMVYDGEWKYMVSGLNGQNEMLFNLTTDPGEMRNLSTDERYRQQLLESRKQLVEWYNNNHIDIESKYIRK